jgi:hypothetical protein
MSHPVQRLAAITTGLLFMAAGCLKAADPAAFALDIQNYRILPWTGAVLLALYLPWLEVLCGAALIFRVAYRGALAITAALLALFLAASASARYRGLDIACGCFGHGTGHGHWPVLLGDTLLLSITLSLLRADLRPRARATYARVPIRD